MRLSFSKRPKIFYGWWIVFAGFMLALYLDGIVYYGFTAIFEPIAQEFRWSYTQISFAAALRGFESGLLAPVMGYFVDRFGPRRILSVGIVVVILGLIVLSRTTSLGMFYGAFILIAAGASALGSTVLTTAIANWFQRKAGLAFGIMTSGYGFCGVVVLLIVELIHLYQWRTTVLILAGGMLLIGVPLVSLVRHRPEQYGYHTDGDAEDVETVQDRQSIFHSYPKDFETIEALKSSAFWHIAGAIACQTLVMGAVITHIMPYLSSLGISRECSGLIAFSIGLTSIVGRLGFGLLADRLNKKKLAAVASTSTAIGIFFFSLVWAGKWILVPFVIFFSLGFGAMITGRSVLVREYFGRSNFGTINGVMLGMMSLASMVGIAVPGWVFDTQGGYNGIWLVFTIFPLLASIIIATTPPVRIAQIRQP